MVVLDDAVAESLVDHVRSMMRNMCDDGSLICQFCCSWVRDPRTHINHEIDCEGPSLIKALENKKEV